jgi:Ala-tRNA(Pro) deacylase
MFKVSEVMTSAPASFKSPLQRKVYERFSELGIPFSRVDTDPGITMEDCRNIDAKLGIHIVKTLFLCNRQQTIFYIYVTTDDKPFVTKDFCHTLGIPRVSFAPEDKLEEIAGVEVGATTVLCSVLDSARDVKFVIDKDAISGDMYACTDGTATCFVCIKTSDLLEKYLPSTGHEPVII